MTKPISIRVFTKEPDNTVEEITYQANDYRIEDGILFLLRGNLITEVFATGYWLQVELVYEE